MKPKLMRNLAVLALMNAAVATHAWGQATVVFNPTTLGFNLDAPDTKQLTISLSTGQSTLLTYSLSAGLRISGSGVNSGANQVQVPGTYNVTVVPSEVPFGATTGTITLSGQGVTTNSLTVNYTGTGGGGGGSFYTNISSIQFTPSDTVRSIPLFSNTGTVPSYYPQVTNYSDATYTNWLQTNPPLYQQTASNSINAFASTAGLPPGVYSANLVLTPLVGGYSAVTIPVTLTVGGGANSVLSVSPQSITFSYPVGTAQSLSQSLSVSSPTQVTFNVAVSSTIANLIQVSAGSGTTNTTLSVSVPFPQFTTTPVSGTITLTPTSGSNLNPYVVPVTINPTSGGGTGFGTLQVSPSTLSFSAIAGGERTAPQELVVTSSDPQGQIFNVTATSSNSFLNAQVSSVFTPSRIVVTANPANLAPGTYSGQISVTPLSGIGSGVAINIPVTFRVLPEVTVTANPNSVTLTARTGQTAASTREVTLTTSTSATDIPYTLSTSTSAGGQWLSVSPTSGTGIPSTITISANAQGLAIGTYTGEVTLGTGGANLLTIPVTLNVIASGTLQVTPTSLTFNHRTTDSTAPATQSIQVTSTSGGPALNWNAAATTNAGGNWLQATASGTTPGSVVVTVIPTGLQPGTYTGRVRITSSGATNSPQDVTVMLNVTAPAVPQIFSFLNAASFTTASASPGLIFTMRGMDLGPATGATASLSGGMFPTTLGGTRVLIDGTPAPLLYSSANQVNGVVPYAVANRSTVTLTVERDGVVSAQQTLNVRPTSPGLFTLNANGSGQVAALNQDGTVNSAANPAQAGSIVSLYGTGLGTANPALTTGGVVALTPPFPRFDNLVQVRVGGIPAEILYAGPAPGLVAGAAQFNIRIPPQTTPGSNVYVQVESGGVGSENLTTIAVR